MGRFGRTLYIGMLLCFAAIIAVCAIAGLWIWTAAALAFGLIAAISGRFVFGKKWLAPPAKERTRAVTRRRR